MGIPYIMLDQKFLSTQAPVIAQITGLDLDSVIGKGTRLFAWVIDFTSSKTKPPDGMIALPFAEASDVIEGVAGWTGERGRFTRAFEFVKIIERLELGMKIHGTSRYHRTWAKNAHAWCRKSAAKVPQSGTKSAAKVPGDGDGDGEVTVSEKSEPPAPKQKPVAQPEPRKPSLQERFAAWFEEARRLCLEEKYIPDEVLPIPRLNKQLGFVKNADPARLARGAELYVRDTWAQGLDPPAPLSIFAKQWSRWYSKANREEQAA